MSDLGYSHPHDRAIMALTEIPEETRHRLIELAREDRHHREVHGDD